MVVKGEELEAYTNDLIGHAKTTIMTHETDSEHLGGKHTRGRRREFLTGLKLGFMHRRYAHLDR
jgi:hypothetical protein